LSAPAVAVAATGGVRATGNLDEAPPSALGVAIATSLLFIVIAAVVAAMRIARKRGHGNQAGQRHRYGAETEHMVEQIDSAWAERDQVKLSQLVSPQVMDQWQSRLASAMAEETPAFRVDRVRARFVSRELPDPDEEDRVVMHVRARCHPSA
jgi:predicted lipid-binding transport protein (Tim44 family)